MMVLQGNKENHGTHSKNYGSTIRVLSGAFFVNFFKSNEINKLEDQFISIMTQKKKICSF